MNRIIKTLMLPLLPLAVCSGAEALTIINNSGGAGVPILSGGSYVTYQGPGGVIIKRPVAATPTPSPTSTPTPTPAPTNNTSGGSSTIELEENPGGGVYDNLPGN